MVLLGDDYLEACEINNNVSLAGPCFFFCGSRAAKRLPDLPNLHTIELAARKAIFMRPDWTKGRAG
jgi:hypothetical protein